jgi:hypothetical protein
MPNTDRPEAEFKTSGGHTVVLRDYITGLEHRQIRSIYARALKADADASQVEYEADNLAIEIVVTSLDGGADNIVSRVLALPLIDFKEVIAQIGERIEGKKKSETAS